MSVGQVVEAIVKSLIIILFLLTAFAYMTLYERRLVGRIQARYGPNRVGPGGFLQPVADGVKLAFKQSIIPRSVDLPLYILAPAISVVTALAAFAVIPVGPRVNIFGREINFWLADFNVGLLFVLAMSSLGAYGIVLGGYSSNNKYSLLGGLRAAAQLVSYELSLGLALIGVVMLSGSLNLVDIVNGQRNGFWYILVQPIGFVIYLISAIAETNRAPFDLPEAESELVAGFMTEYSGFRYSLYFLGEYVAMLVISATAAIVFLGGPAGPILPGPIWLLLKVAGFIFLYIWLRATLPRFRYDQLMGMAWKLLLPLVLVSIFVTALGRAWRLGWF